MIEFLMYLFGVTLLSLGIQGMVLDCVLLQGKQTVQPWINVLLIVPGTLLLIYAGSF